MAEVSITTAPSNDEEVRALIQFWTGQDEEEFNALADSYGVHWILDADGNYAGLEFCIAFGGPNAWVRAERGKPLVENVSTWLRTGQNVIASEFATDELVEHYEEYYEMLKEWGMILDSHISATPAT